MNLTFNNSEESEEGFSITLNDPLNGIKIKHNIKSCLEHLNNYRQNEHILSKNDDLSIHHWWTRKWQVSLDYYLSSQSDINNLHKALQSKSLEKIGVYLPSGSTPVMCNQVQALITRKTHRKFRFDPLPLTTLSTILRSLDGELFPEIWNYYIAIFNVQGIQPGLYLYCPLQHGLILVKEGNFREKLVTLLCGMSATLTASFTMIFSIDLITAQQQLPYERALREIYIDSGRMAQKLILKGIQYHIGALPSPAMRDTSMCQFLGIDPTFKIPIYSVSMGIITEVSLPPIDQGAG